MSLQKVRTFFGAMSTQKAKAAAMFVIAFMMTQAANASIFGDILADGMGQTIIKSLFVMWGAAKLIDTMGKIFNSESGAVKEGIQAVILMVIGWEWSTIIDSLGFTK